MTDFWPYIIFVGLAIVGIAVSMYLWKRLGDSEDEQ